MKGNVSSAYIHVPFCSSKCHYCDFNSYSDRGHLINDYFKAVRLEIQQYAGYINDITGTKEKTAESEDGYLETIFIGGGTPSIVSPDHIKEILISLDSAFGIKPDAEITIECNPGTVDIYKVREYRDAGINRISIGLQSTSDRILQAIGRTHTYSDFLRTYGAFISEGFNNINVDIIDGLPGQNLTDFSQTVDQLTELAPKHISVYSLSINEGCMFYKNYDEISPMLPDDSEERNMYHYAREKFKSYGMIQYEISNYAFPGYECKHNLACWQGRQYFGFGAGAHSFINNKRAANCPDPYEYINKISNADSVDPFPASETIEILSKEAEEKEYFLLGFRLLEGVSNEGFRKRSGRNMDEYKIILENLIREGLIEENYGKYKLTLRGLDYANCVFREFV